MEITPRISTSAPKNAPSHYLAYLNSPAWRMRRNTALVRAGYRCEQCHSKRELQVHHLTYDRLGAELDADLKVLCAGCHEGQHPEHQQHDYLGIYLKLAEDVIARETRFDSMADFIESLKLRCAGLKIPYNADKLMRALEVVRQKYPQLVFSAPIREFVEQQEAAPMSSHEARQFLRKLIDHGYQLPRRMPEATEPISAQERAIAKALEFTAQEIKATMERCDALEAAVAKDAQ